MNAHWRLRPHEPGRILALSRRAGISPLVAQLLINRGIEQPERAVAFLEARLGSLHDPELLPGAVQAAERITGAIREGRKIVVYGDYDVDGVCGTSIIWSCLRMAGAATAEYYIPHRVEEGYGLSAVALERLARECKPELIITVDCGISAVSEAELARELGIELIVTDHHTIGPTLPAARAVVHPRLPGGSYPNGDLCGAGVAFKLAWQICKSFGDGKRASPHLRDFLVGSLGLVALATIADVVPLSDENRIIVRHGLAGIAAGQSVGLRALMEVSGALDKRRLTTGMIGFGLAPRINAAGRLERAMVAVEMLTTDDPVRARAIAADLDRCNTLRQEVERRILDEAHAMLEEGSGARGKSAIVLGHRDWHPGVIGVVAGRLAETFHRPAIVVSLGPALSQGSARSIPGFDLYAAINECSEGLVAFGGHAAAAGLKLTEEYFPVFARRFDEYCSGKLTPAMLERVLVIDDEVALRELSYSVVAEIEKLEPYGIGNPRPMLFSGGVEVLGQPRPVGEQRNHLQLRVKQGDVVLKAIAWNLAERGQALLAGTHCSIVYHPTINEWNNHREVQLEIKDFALADDDRNRLGAARAVSRPERARTP
jgi:single-stranded-DNA-specific exonuclease